MRWSPLSSEPTLFDKNFETKLASQENCPVSKVWIVVFYLQDGAKPGGDRDLQFQLH